MAKRTDAEWMQIMRGHRVKAEERKALQDKWLATRKGKTMGHDEWIRYWKENQLQ